MSVDKAFGLLALLLSGMFFAFGLAASVSSTQGFVTASGLSVSGGLLLTGVVAGYYPGSMQKKVATGAAVGFGVTAVLILINPDVYQMIISVAPGFKIGGNIEYIDISLVVISNIVCLLFYEALMNLAEPSPTGRQIGGAAFISVISTSILLPVLFYPTQTAYQISLTLPGIVGVTLVDALTDYIK